MSICNRKKTMVVSDNTKQAESLGTVFKNQGRKGFSLSKKMFKTVSKIFWKSSGKRSKR